VKLKLKLKPKEKKLTKQTLPHSAPAFAAVVAVDIPGSTFTT